MGKLRQGITEEVEIKINYRLLLFVDKVPYYTYSLSFNVACKFLFSRHFSCSVHTNYEPVGEEEKWVVGKYYDEGSISIVTGIVSYSRRSGKVVVESVVIDGVDIFKEQEDIKRVGKSLLRGFHNDISEKAEITILDRKCVLFNSIPYYCYKLRFFPSISYICSLVLSKYEPANEEDKWVIGKYVVLRKGSDKVEECITRGTITYRNSFLGAKIKSVVIDGVDVFCKEING